MKWVPFMEKITDPHRIEGNLSGKRRRFLTWWPYRCIADIFGHSEALLVEVGPGTAHAGYQLGLRQEGEGDDRTLVTAELLHHEKFLVVISKRPWLAFLVDREGAAVPGRITRCADKAELEYTGLPLI